MLLAIWRVRGNRGSVTDEVTVRQPRVAVWAYACNPARGSDPGATWGYVRVLLEHAELVVFHSPEDTDQLQKWRTANPQARCEFVLIEEPGWTQAVRRGFGIHRQLQFVNYLAWLRSALAKTRELHAHRPFDAVAHASYGNYWLPSPAWKLGIPSLWGPLGGGVRTPVRLWRTLGIGGIVAELERSISVSLAASLPATRRTHRRVTVPIVETEETLQRLPRRRHGDAVLVNRAVLIEKETAGVGQGSGKAHHLAPGGFLFTSALWGKKGPWLAVAALAHADPRINLAFVNEGYDQRRLERLARRLGVAERVRFLGRIPRDELFAHMRGAVALVFTGLREEGGVGLAEALYQGLPVVVLDHGGAGLMARQALDPQRVRRVAPAGPRETAARLGAAMTRLYLERPEGREPTLDRDPHLTAVETALRSALPRSASVSAPRAS
jgi:glycosyltransferase involved in cell wall biosynthesis